MSEMPVEVEGTVREDGSLELDEKLKLAAGRVKVTVRPVEVTLTPLEDFLEMTAKIRASQEARGYVPRSVEEIDAEIKEFRDEMEEEFLAVERLQEECQRARQQTTPETESGG